MKQPGMASPDPRYTSPKQKTRQERDEGAHCYDQNYSAKNWPKETVVLCSLHRAFVLHCLRCASLGDHRKLSPLICPHCPIIGEHRHRAQMTDVTSPVSINDLTAYENQSSRRRCGRACFEYLGVVLAHRLQEKLRVIGNSRTEDQIACNRLWV